MTLKWACEKEAKEYEILKWTIVKNHDVFSWTDFDLGCTNVTKHSINQHRQRKTNQTNALQMTSSFERTVMENQIEQMQQKGIVQESNSPWGRHR